MTWKANVIVAAHDAASKRRHARESTRVQVPCSMEWLSLLDEAAASRGLPRTMYVRQALCAFIAADLDLPLRTVVSRTPDGHDAPAWSKIDLNARGPWVAAKYEGDKVDP